MEKTMERAVCACAKVREVQGSECFGFLII